MDKDCEQLLEKIKSITKSLTSKLNDELYPKSLGKRVMMQVPEQRLVVISKYEGMGLVLKDLGMNIEELEKMIGSEADKTLEGEY